MGLLCYMFRFNGFMSERDFMCQIYDRFVN